MNTAGRRRAQAIGGYKNIRPQQRPAFSKVSAEKSQNRLQKLIQGIKLRQSRKKG